MTLKLVHVIKFENEKKKIFEIKLEFKILDIFADYEFSAGWHFSFMLYMFTAFFSGMGYGFFCS